MRDNRPIGSVCSLGKDRWFWVVWDNYDAVCERRARAEGHEATKEAAEARMMAAAGPAGIHAGPYSGWAREYHHELCVRRRAEKRSDATDAAPVEYVYLWHHEDWSEMGTHYPAHFTEARVVKKTAKRVYVEWKVDHTLMGDVDVRTVILDRAELERVGRTEAPGLGWYQEREFYLKPERPQEPRKAPACVLALGLRWPCTDRDIRRAYRRKAKEHHPDAGGDGQEFIALQKAYEEALRLVERGAA